MSHNKVGDEELKEFLTSKRKHLKEDILKLEEREDFYSTYLARGLRSVIRNIDLALSQVGVGGYGKCCNCGEGFTIEILQEEFQIARCVNCFSQFREKPVTRMQA